MQEFGLELVLVGEARDKGKASLEAFKLAVVSADPVKYIPLAFPQWNAKRDDDITTKDIEESAGEWTFEDTTPRTQEDIEAALRDLMSSEMELGLTEADQYDPEDGWQ